MQYYDNQLIVFTGAPGAGKTSTLEELARLGWSVSPEAARAIIRHSMHVGGPALPWGDLTAFRDAMLLQTEKDYWEARKLPGPVFFDRGWPDSETVPFSEEILTQMAPLRYYPEVFVFRPWEEIYSQDAERKQSFAEACQSCEHMCQSYLRLGYTLVDVPPGSIPERARWILRHLRLVYTPDLGL